MHITGNLRINTVFMHVLDDKYGIEHFHTSDQRKSLAMYTSHSNDSRTTTAGLYSNVT